MQSWDCTTACHLGRSRKGDRNTFRKYGVAVFLFPRAGQQRNKLYGDKTDSDAQKPGIGQKSGVQIPEGHSLTVPRLPLRYLHTFLLLCENFIGYLKTNKQATVIILT